MKLNGKWTGAVAGVFVMAAAGLSVVGLTGTVATTNDTDSVISVNQDEKEDVAADLQSVADRILVKYQNPATDNSKEQVTEATTEAETVAQQETTVAPVVEDVAETETETVAKETVSEYENKFMATVEELNIRAEASQDSEVVGKISVGAGGDVLEHGTEWTKIQSGSVTGYVATGYIVTGADAEARAKADGTLKVTVLTNSLRIRKSASEDSGLYGLADEGDVFTGIGYEGNFIGVYYDGEIGYLSLDYTDVQLVIGHAISMEEIREQARLEEEAKAEAARKEAEAKEEAARRAQQEKEEEEEALASHASQYVETVQTSAYNVSESDAYLLACLVMAEAGYEPYEGKLATANVVLNRLSGGYYGNTMSDVIYARGQFSVAASGKLASVIAKGPNSESERAAREALSGVNNVPEYANFCATYVAHYSRYNNYTIIGSQVFYN